MATMALVVKMVHEIVIHTHTHTPHRATERERERRQYSHLPTLTLATSAFSLKFIKNFNIKINFKWVVEYVGYFILFFGFGSGFAFSLSLSLHLFVLNGTKMQYGNILPHICTICVGYIFTVCCLGNHTEIVEQNERN